MLQRNEKVVEWHEKYGPVVCIRPGEVSISDSSAMRDIYGAAGKHAKSGYFDHFVAYGEQAIFAIRPYRDHSQKRKLTSSFYQATSIYKLIVENFVRERVHALIKQFDDMLTTSSSIDIYPMFNRYAFDNISRLAYGPRQCSYTIENDCPERRILSGLKRSQVWGPLQLNFPLLYKPTAALMTFLKNQKDFLTAEDDLTEWNTKTLSAATADAKISEDHSVLRRLTEVKDTNGLPLSHNFIASELLDNLNAAQETVTVALTYLIYHLSRNPDWQARVRAELLALPIQPDSYPSFASIDAAPIFHACLNEVYRLNPGSSGRAERIVPAGGREYAKTYLPGGTIVSASTIALHQNPALFPHPTLFLPSRWLNTPPQQLRAMETSFLPFGYGARICLGKAFATLQIKLLAASLYLRYSTRMDDLSATTEESMRQSGTQDALPRGLRCDVLFRRVERGR